MSTNSSPNSGAKRPPLALIAGPTASGKSDLAVKLALALKARGKEAAVINADSAQVYCDLKVLSARPDEDEMQGVPHHLFGDWDGATACSTADWAAAAKRVIAELHAEGAVPILVGGTGLYMRTLLDGISPIPPIDPDIRAEIRAMDHVDARAALEIEDPEAAARLAPADTTRTARALEVVRSTGKPMTHWHGNPVGGIGDEVDLHPLILVPDRAKLYARCDIRFEWMLDQGAVAEVEALMARALSAELPVMRAIGVREIAAWLEGRVSRDEMIQSGQMSTRQYAKRQFTWFRNQPPDWWTRAEPENTNTETIFERLLRR
ncbi:tRNA (adenosine(37)-N6)-dimethylallyltransferase MiaA [Pontixanthobacter aestiaquae]|uniref:tRNA dimethylallyltransferase n=1 Tax=Pontixanthobacter aestiaquae TaxID=1509367 RepID=A0A844ZCB5_9SPHN|nr:tRNA (adenosine(37)-N6)-dimethylallyltransferase MiaA [Pontixanthobacter aestiaquae]MDN3645533.1 tRNA (adenosine(37)-N6)-dimethylallyltransferase MiaA [Pontixanthobacter aestiaquae]MXO83469.1 tRNA (adenosine(37)-N6)-dimethylallyltransferase MiaA [Pontixanthobacter aestiaquae]